MSVRSRSVLYEIVWHSAFLVILLWLLPAALFGGPFWSVTGLNRQLIDAFAAAYFAAATANLALTYWSQLPRILTALAVAAIALAAVCIWVLLLPGVSSYSRALIVAGTGLLVVGLVAPSLDPAPRRIPLRAIALAALVVASLIAVGRSGGTARGFFAALSERLSGRSASETRKKRSVVLPSSAYTLTATYYSEYLPAYKQRAVGGAVAPDPNGRGYLLARSRGDLYRLTFDSAGELHVEPIGLRVPINNAEFEADVPKVGILTEDFRVADILTLAENDGTRIFASHHFWIRKDKCFVVRVSTIVIPREGRLPEGAPRDWKTVFESQPCLRLKHARGEQFAGLQVGGRMKLLGQNRLLLTVGDHQFDGWFGTPNYVGDPHASYGKTILIDLAKGTSSIFTTGHRNEQGLEIDSSGRIWETEHGPQGGDELNLLRQGQDYGWPNHTYGTEYGSVTWPLNEQHLGQENYVRPIYAWVPSIGISNLVSVRDSAFERWRNDLIIASLRGKELWRVRIEEGRAVYAEPIVIGERIRDITTAGRGELILWTDQETIVRITPARGLNKGAEAFVVTCGSCHGVQFNAIGPTLGGVVGRSVASVPDYPYSDALRRLGGKWTVERLDGFLTRPDSVVPGTAMRFDGVSDRATRRVIISYLESLR